MQQRQTPPLFRRGPSAEVRLVVLVVLALSLMLIDARMRVLEPVRRVVAIALYPFQRVVLAPRDLVEQIDEWVNAANLIRQENEALQRQRIELAQVSTRAQQVETENAQLRRLLGITEHTSEPTVVVEVLYEPPGDGGGQQRLVFNKGSRAGLAPGMPVIDEGGVVGQLVRVTPMTAEAALLTDDRVSIPVQVLRNGLRLIAFGTNTPGEVEVRYLSANADVRPGDILITSGVGGFFPAGLRVAKVTSVDRNSASGFAQAMAEPLSHPERYRHFLVLQVDVGKAAKMQEEGEDDN